MASLLERLTAALPDRYQVEGELARGGMGAVFLASDRTLDRLVAIKVLPPEAASAIGVERFLRETKLAAALRHPYVVPVHDAGAVEGLLYYVMDYVPGEALAERIAHGPVPVAEAVRIVAEVADALSAAHALGIVHRDIKPGNILVSAGHAMVTDFGIAGPLVADADARITQEGILLGTPAYLSPEQVDTAAPDPRSDIYSLGVVLYELLAGQPPFAGPSPVAVLAQHRFTPAPDVRTARPEVPAAVAAVLRRALAKTSEERWPDAAGFRAALLEAAAPAPLARRRSGVLILGSAALLAVAGLALLLARPKEGGPEDGTTLRIEIEPFEQRGATDRPWLADSLARALARGLSGVTDIRAIGPGDARPDRWRAELVLRGVLEARGDSLRVMVNTVRTRSGAPKISESTAGALADVPRLADSIAGQVVLAIWRGPGPLARWLPIRALPQSAAGLEALLNAERLFAQDRFAEAWQAYADAEATDSTCRLCAWRRADAGRWLGQPGDTALTARYRLHLDSFPPYFQSLIRAGFTRPLAARLDSLEAAARRTPGFYLAWMSLGDELNHRGPLAGELRREAADAFRRAVEVRPDFAPAWEHLAWVLIAEGDEAGAREAIDSYSGVAAGAGTFPVVVGGLFELGFAWRFRAPAEARRTTSRLLADPMLAAYEGFESAPRWLPSFDAPAGAVAVGEGLARQAERPQAVLSGLVAQSLGLAALGRLDSALAQARRLEQRARRARKGATALFAAELEVALWLFHGAGSAAAWPEIRRRLELYTARGADGTLGRRAAWVLALASRRARAERDVERFRSLLDEEPLPRPFSRLLEAHDRASQGRWSAALATSEPLLALDSAGQAGDPFFRAALHLLRAEWYERLPDIERARRELRWHENSDLASGGLADDPQAAEVDWAFGTLARWRRAQLLDRAGESGEEVCRSYAAVARLWAEAEAEYAARAETARARMDALGCATRRRRT